MAQHKVNYTQDGGLPVALTSIDKVVNWVAQTLFGHLLTVLLVVVSR